MSGGLDSLRGLLPDAEVDGMEALLAELEEAVSSPQALRRWKRRAAREAAERAVWEGLAEQRGLSGA
jgi:hypothetical protein